MHIRNKAALIVLVWACVAHAGTSDKRDTFDELKQECAARWPSDYTMQEACVKQEGQAAIELGQLTDENRDSKVFAGILNECGQQWPGKVVTYDYRMMLACVKQQSAAYKRLH